MRRAFRRTRSRRCSLVPPSPAGDSTSTQLSASTPGRSARPSPRHPGPAAEGTSSSATRAATRGAAAAAVITVLTVVSRIAGFGRTYVFLQTVGAGPLGNIYNAANTIPNIVFELVAGGALASLVVPLLAGAVAAGDRARVAAVTSAAARLGVSA